jgi:hypothetical protein
MSIKSAFCGLVLVASLRLLSADQTTVSFDSGSQQIFDNPSLHGGNNVVLTGGSSVDGNGDVLQLGYFTGPNFTGAWVPLSGATSLNTAVIPTTTTGQANPSGERYNQTSIGDMNSNGAGNGTFAISLDFVAGSSTSGNNLPAAGTPLGLRFYNGTSIANSTYYNTVEDATTWLWKAPNTPPVNVLISLDDSGLQWESVVADNMPISTAFHTSIPITAVPEPATWAGSILPLLALAFPAIRRRFKR